MFAAKPRKRSDRHYGTQRWRKLAQRIVERDHWCYAEDCRLLATCADHIWPVTDETSDQEFFAEYGLRGSCWAHNRIRSWTIGDAYHPPSPRPLGGEIRFRRGKPRIG